MADAERMETKPGRTIGGIPLRLSWTSAFLGALVLVSVMGMLIGSAPTTDAQPVAIAPHLAPAPAKTVASTGSAAPAATTAPSSESIPGVVSAQSLSLGVSVAPAKICAYDQNTCSAGASLARVTLTANAGNGGVLSWPAVQVAFIIETTVYDGVYDPTAYDPGTDPCASSQEITCEESNGVPFFVKNAQLIATEIQSANPHSKVSFALVDYFATLTDHDDGDGNEYHVDIADFVPASEFGSAVSDTFQAQVLSGGWTYSDSDFSDNILDSSSITALYGTIIGSGLTWTNDTHHVIVWMGSTVPRDPNYVVDYRVSASDDESFSPYFSSSCEPSYKFILGSSPNCEGWIRSQDGNATHSIAELAKTAPACTDSIGGVCTVDAIDLYTVTTDPFSKGWPSGRTGGGAGGSTVIKDVDKVIAAGCDLSAATGGTWDGPAGFVCADGQTGTLEYVAHGPYDKPDTNNPTLLAALRGIGFGPVLETQVASGTDKPIFQWLPFGNIVLPSEGEIQSTAACYHNGAPTRTCQTNATLVDDNGVNYLTWNWSTNATSNVMYIGDSWTASFNVMARGPPFASVPVDACTTQECRDGGSGTILGMYTSATYVPYTNNSIITTSFPLGTVIVQSTPPTPLPPAVTPPPPPAPPPFPIPAASPLPVANSIGVGNNVGVANVSLQATAAGFLGAGFVRVSVKNRPIAMKVAAKSGAVSSKFEAGLANKDASGGIGHFE